MTLLLTLIYHILTATHFNQIRMVIIRSTKL